MILLAVKASVILSCSKLYEYDLAIQNVGLFDGHQYIGTVNIAINQDTMDANTTS